MLGAIAGDIIGSAYEFGHMKSKDFPLFSADCTFTDDTVMTLAVAEALMDAAGDPDEFERRAVRSMRRFGRAYPDSDYGIRFGGWLESDDPQPYNSWGNGSAMRVSSVGWAFATLEETERFAAVSARVTHNNPEGVKGAQATAAAIFLARSGASKAEIKAYIARRYGYDLDRTVDGIRPGYRFDESCQRTVPEAIVAFLEAADFEDAVRNAVSLGGDADTLACIAGSIAEAAFGVPEEIKTRALGYLDAPLLAVLERWKRRRTG